MKTRKVSYIPVLMLLQLVQRLLGFSVTHSFIPSFIYSFSHGLLYKKTLLPPGPSLPGLWSPVGSGDHVQPLVAHSESTLMDAGL